MGKKKNQHHIEKLEPEEQALADFVRRYGIKYEKVARKGINRQIALIAHRTGCGLSMNKKGMLLAAAPKPTLGEMIDENARIAFGIAKFLSGLILGFRR